MTTKKATTKKATTKKAPSVREVEGEALERAIDFLGKRGIKPLLTEEQRRVYRLDIDLGRDAQRRVEAAQARVARYERLRAGLESGSESLAGPEPVIPSADEARERAVESLARRRQRAMLVASLGGFESLIEALEQRLATAESRPSRRRARAALSAAKQAQRDLASAA